jgi:hypothetical protein
MESCSNNLLEKKAPSPCELTMEFYQKFKGEMISILYSLLQKIEAEAILPYSVYKSSITLTLKQDKVIFKKEK